jgi:hypothetical protein
LGDFESQNPQIEGLGGGSGNNFDFSNSLLWHEFNKTQSLILDSSAAVKD